MSNAPRQLLPKTASDLFEVNDTYASSYSSRHLKKTTTACLACKQAKRKVNLSFPPHLYSHFWSKLQMFHTLLGARKAAKIARTRQHQQAYRNHPSARQKADLFRF